MPGDETVQGDGPMQLSSVVMNTANQPQKALATQISLSSEIFRHGAGGSKNQTDIYSTLFICRHPFLDGRGFTELWHLYSGSAELCQNKTEVISLKSLFLLPTAEISSFTTSI